jgi:hypothetical protein
METQPANDNRIWGLLLILIAAWGLLSRVVSKVVYSPVFRESHDSLQLVTSIAMEVVFFTLFILLVLRLKMPVLKVILILVTVVIFLLDTYRIVELYLESGDHQF